MTQANLLISSLGDALLIIVAYILKHVPSKSVSSTSYEQYLVNAQFRPLTRQLGMFTLYLTGVET